MYMSKKLHYVHRNWGAGKQVHMWKHLQKSIVLCLLLSPCLRVSPGLLLVSSPTCNPSSCPASSSLLHCGQKHGSDKMTTGVSHFCIPASYSCSLVFVDCCLMCFYDLPSVSTQHLSVSLKSFLSAGKHHDWVFPLLPELWLKRRTQILCNGLPKISGRLLYAHLRLIYTHHQEELMKSLQLVTAIHHEDDGLTFVCNSHKVMTALIVMFRSNHCCGDFSVVS